MIFIVGRKRFVTFVVGRKGFVRIDDGATERVWRLW